MSKKKSRFELDTIRFNQYTNESVKCQICGHTMLFEGNRHICTHCGNWVYKNRKFEFQCKLKEILKKY